MIANARLRICWYATGRRAIARWSDIEISAGTRSAYFDLIWFYSFFHFRVSTFQMPEHTSLINSYCVSRDIYSAGCYYVMPNQLIECELCKQAAIMGHSHFDFFFKFKQIEQFFWVAHQEPEAISNLVPIALYSEHTSRNLNFPTTK